MSSSQAPRIAFTTLGCKVNQSETDLYARQFASAGFACVPFDAPADVYVVNTCTVTHVADRKSRQLLGQARRANRDALIVAVGCYASIAGDALADERTLVIRNRDKERMLGLVQGRLRHEAIDLPYFADREKYVDTDSGYTRSRAMVKVQDGCDSHCAYCIIPRARGRSRSVRPDVIIQRVNALVREGHAEVVITGVDLGSYGDNEPALPDLGSLLRRILDETDVGRIRVSSLEPGDFKESWLGLWDDKRLCRHLHAPLQAGSASVLARMGRSYTPEEYAAMVAACRAAVPDMTLATDVMTGFPGETVQEFEECLEFIQRMSFDGMHVFKYSKRSGTPAGRTSNQVAEETKNDRSRLLRDEASSGVRRLLARHHGTTREVAWEGEREGVRRGLTDTNVRVFASSDRLPAGGLSRMRLIRGFRDGLWCEPELGVRNSS
ncbi:MAG: tRNA (N(6)-L-threonylcarbamoyladenosine(37)-C(2))-methylthiotransferase MtaB [Chloroflexota bacterium]